MLASALVEDLQDGGMGSVRVLSKCQSEPVLGEVIAEAEHTDDGVLVSIVISIDKGGELYEADFWKLTSRRWSAIRRPRT